MVKKYIQEYSIVHTDKYDGLLLPSEYGPLHPGHLSDEDFQSQVEIQRRIDDDIHNNIIEVDFIMDDNYNYCKLHMTTPDNYVWELPTLWFDQMKSDPGVTWKSDIIQVESFET